MLRKLRLSEDYDLISEASAVHLLKRLVFPGCVTFHFFPTLRVLNLSPQDCAIAKYPFNCIIYLLIPKVKIFVFCVYIK